ncbi:ABC transporter permease [Desulfovibrio inopinatus]|uniref:ABC transporter permease n=1 Tax=Desulfovibrio inopinatus TaxID=102109 RepID=UPI0004855F21|nr:ABC transporter permease subunit [Desulfovibrio inopinatus]
MTRTRLLLHFTPLGVPFLLLFLGGFSLTVAQSFGWFTPLTFTADRFDGYLRLLSPSFLESFLFTVYVAFTSAFLATAGGAILAWAIWSLPTWMQRSSNFYKTSLVLPHIAVAFIVMTLFARSGVISSLAHALGLISSMREFPSILYSGNGLGLILAYIYKGLGFSILMTHTALCGLDRRLPIAARMLGAGRVRIFFTVIAPHMAPALNTAFLILFLYAFGAFDIASLLSESRPAMLSIDIYNLYFKRDLVNRPAAMAMLVSMFFFSTLFIAFYVKIARSIHGQGRKL